MVATLVTSVAVVLLCGMVLTALGARRRGRAVPVAFLAGIFFPVTWTIWYVRDEHPYRRAPDAMSPHG